MENRNFFQIHSLFLLFFFSRKKKINLAVLFEYNIRLYFKFITFINSFFGHYNFYHLLIIIHWHPRRFFLFCLTTPILNIVINIFAYLNTKRIWIKRRDPESLIAALRDLLYMDWKGISLKDR